MRVVRQTPQAINKPMLIVGIERSLLAVILCFAVVVATKVRIPLGIVVLVGGYLWAKRTTRCDPDRIKIALQEMKLAPIYDPVKRQVAK